MNILSFDTCFDACSAAVFRGDSGDISGERELMRRGHAEALLPMVDRVMHAAGLKYRELDRVAVTRGPGTFTGSRVGMSAALAFAVAHDIPIVTYSSLQLIARAAIEALGPAGLAGLDGVMVARDARRDSVYVEFAGLEGQELEGQELEGQELGCHKLEGPALRTVTELRARIENSLEGRRFFALGSGVPLILAAGGPLAGIRSDWPGQTPPPGIEEPDARFMLADAAVRRPTPDPVPLYLRPPDAKPSGTPPLARAVGREPERP